MNIIFRETYRLYSEKEKRDYIDKKIPPSLSWMKIHITDINEEYVVLEMKAALIPKDGIEMAMKFFYSLEAEPIFALPLTPERDEVVGHKLTFYFN